MAPFDDETPAPKQKAGNVSSASAAQGETQALGAAIAAAIDNNLQEISKIARRNGLELEDATQQAYVLLRERPQLIYCEAKERLDALYWMLREYAYPSFDAMNDAKSVEDLAVPGEIGLDEVLPAAETRTLDQWQTDEPQPEIIKAIAKMVSVRSHGRETALDVLKAILDGAGRSTMEVAQKLGIDQRRVQQIINLAETAAWKMS